MDTIAMGGYGSYVWSSFGLMFIVFLISALQARARHRTALREVTQRIKAMEVEH
jgi:heme exporter protein D